MPARDRFRPSFEALEERSLLAANLPVIEFVGSSGSLSVGENGKSHTNYVFVKCTGPMRGKVTVDLVPEDVTTTANKDYKVSGIKKTLTFTPKECLQRLKFPALNDGEPEEDERVRTSLQNPRNAQLGGNKKQIVTIKDNDSKLKPWDLTFRGDGYSPITADDSTETYWGQHWYDADHDGNADGPGDQRDPVSYSAGSWVELMGRLYMERPAPWGDPTREPDRCYVRAKGPDGAILIGQTELTNEDENTMRLQNALATQPFDKQVDVQDHYQLTWEYRYEKGEWYTAGTTDSQVYVTMAKPEVYPLYHTVVDIGCRQGRGLGADQQQQLVANVWAEFADRSVHRVKDGAELTYWNGGVATATNTGGLLRDANGQCGSWAEFFRDVLRAQGLTSATKVEVLGPATTFDPTGRAFLLVKNWTFTGSGTHAAHGTFTYEITKDVAREVGAPAQGNVNPVAQFKNHFVVEVGGRYYDPSYGLGPFASQNDWENAALDGFYVHGLDENGKPRLYAKRNDATVTETVFRPT